MKAESEGGRGGESWTRIPASSFSRQSRIPNVCHIYPEYHFLSQYRISYQDFDSMCSSRFGFFKPSGRRDAQDGKEQKLRWVGGGVGNRKHRFLSFPAPLVPATTFFAPFSTMPLCVSRSWILAPLSLKETETTTTQAKISVNHAASRVAVKSRIPSRNLAFSRIPHYSSLKSRIPRIPLQTL